MKDFQEALSDGFKHISAVNDPEQLKKLLKADIAVNEEGYYSFSFGDKHEFELCVEPMTEENTYRIVLYKSRVILTEPLIMKTS